MRCTFVALLLSSACLLACNGCAHHHKNEAQPTENPETLEDLKAKRVLYESLLTDAASTQAGWVARDCDALLFSSLFAASLHGDVNPVQITQAEDSPGHWQRRAASFGPCFPGPSDSTISKDMLMGLAWYAWRMKRRDIAERLTDYGLAHAWVMGDPHDNVGKVVLTPADAGIWYQILYRLGGADHPSRKIPDIFPKGLTGFEAHLQVLGILLHNEIDDTAGVTDDALDRLRDHAARQPGNPFFAAALGLFTGDQSAAVALLGDDNQWPRGDLPSSRNHCSAWVIQRDMGSDWQPCDTAGADVLWGADYVWMVDLMTRAPR